MSIYRLKAETCYKMLSRDTKNSVTCEPIDPQLTYTSTVAEFDIVDLYAQERQQYDYC